MKYFVVKADTRTMTTKGARHFGDTLVVHSFKMGNREYTTLLGHVFVRWMGHTMTCHPTPWRIFPC